MGTLTMALAAALLAGSAPEKVSGEVEQRLDLRGEWVGSWRHETGNVMEATLPAAPSPRFGSIQGESKSRRAEIPVIWIVDEGKGRFRLAGGDGLGIYRVQDGQVSLCYRRVAKGYPTTLRGGNGQHLITLRRVKPLK